MTRILRLNKFGLPRQWISREEAATLYAKNQVVWSLGDQPMLMRGGVNRLGHQSLVELAAIIACDGDESHFSFTPRLSNRLLFRRDGYQCMYCGGFFYHGGLTREHIIPKVQNGKNVWTNVVAACLRCNHHKGGRTPEQAGMELLAIPFRPNVFEYMYLANRQIRGDQMDYLQVKFSGQRQWLAA